MQIYNLNALDEAGEHKRRIATEQILCVWIFLGKHSSDQINIETAVWWTSGTNTYSVEIFSVQNSTNSIKLTCIDNVHDRPQHCKISMWCLPNWFVRLKLFGLYTAAWNGKKTKISHIFHRINEWLLIFFENMHEFQSKFHWFACNIAVFCVKVLIYSSWRCRVFKVSVTCFPRWL